MTSKYYLENQDGDRYSLNLEDNITLFDVEGLGVTLNQETASLDKGFYLHVKENVPLGTIAGTLLFRGNAFQNYRAFLNWIMLAQKLYFIYCPYGTDEFYAEAKLNYFTKSHRINDWANMAISFILLTPWYLPTPINLQFNDPSVQNYFAWGISALGTSPLAPNTSGEYSAEIVANGHCDASIKISFSGEINDPKFILRDSSTYEVLGKCALEGKYTGVIILDTAYGHASFTVNGVDMTEYLDLSEEVEPFFRIPTGRVCDLVIDSPQFTGECQANIYEYYRSV